MKRRIESVAARWELPPGSIERLEQLLIALAEDPQAPTSVRDPIRGVDVHVADSLSGFEIDGLRDAGRVIDIGSGAGFPGLVLAVAMPGTQFDLLEATQRKCAFLRRVTEALDLGNVRVICRRAEEWATAGGSEAYDVAVVRAVGLLATVLEYGAPLIRVGGRQVVWKGRRDQDEERAGMEAAELLGMRLLGVEWVGPFAGSRHRHLYTWEKMARTPSQYPRRAGLAKKRPLGGR